MESTNTDQYRVFSCPHCEASINVPDVYETFILDGNIECPCGNGSKLEYLGEDPGNPGYGFVRTRPGEPAKFRERHWLFGLTPL